jgi:nucleoside-diphosphate-sugar epimerase
LAERVLVTGGAGFIGSHLVRRLLESGADVAATVRPGSDLWRLDGVLDWIEVASSIGPLPSADVVYHLAAAGVHPDTDAATVVETNVLGTLRVIEHAQASGAGRFVYCGSCFEYGPGMGLSEDAPLRPVSEYGASKAAGSLLALAAGTAHSLPVTVVRPFTAYGPHEAAHRLVPSVIVDALDGGPIRVTSGGQSRDFVYVTDVVEGLVAATDPRAVGAVLNLCTGKATTVGDLASQVAALVGGVEVLAGAVPDRAVEFPVLSGDPSRAADVLGWRAQTPLEDGLRRSIAWFEEHRDRYAQYRREAAAP